MPISTSPAPPAPLDTSSDSKALKFLGKMCFAAMPVIPFLSQELRADMMDGINRFIAVVESHWVMATIIALFVVGYTLLTIGSARFRRVTFTISESIG